MHITCSQNTKNTTPTTVKIHAKNDYVPPDTLKVKFDTTFCKKPPIELKTRLKKKSSLHPYKFKLTKPFISLMDTIPSHPLKKRKSTYISRKESSLSTISVKQVFPGPIESRAVLPFFNFRTEQGLPSNFIRDVIITKQLDLWAATYEGIFKYDGNRISHYQFEGLGQSTDASCIAEDSEGRLWFGGGRGLIQYDGNQAFIYELENNFNKKIKSLEPAINGGMWVGTWGNGLFYIHDSIIINYTEADGLLSNFVRSIEVDSVGKVWVGTTFGMNCIDEKTISSITPKEGLPDDIIQAIYLDNVGKLWIGTRYGGLSWYDGKKIVTYTTNQGLPSNSITSITADRNGKLWCGTWGGGFFSIKENEIEILSKEENLPSVINKIKADSFGNIWIASEGGGLYRHPLNGFSIYSPENRKLHRINLALAGDRNGLWIGTAINGLAQISNDSIYYHSTQLHMEPYRMNTLVSTSANALWAGSSDGGLWHFSNDKFQINNHNICFSHSRCHALETENDSTFWIGTMIDFLKICNDTIIRFQTIENPISLIKKDNQGNLWLNQTGKGLLKYDKKQLLLYTKKQGLPASEITCMEPFGDSSMLFGTSDQGLYLFNGDYFSLFIPTESLPSNQIMSLLYHNDSSLWVATNNGITHIELKDFQPVRMNLYLEQNGVRSDDFLPESVFLDDSNNIWWGGGSGLVSLNLKNYSKPNLKPSISLDDIFFNEQRIDFRDSTKLMKGVDFEGVFSFSNIPKKLQVSYHNKHLTFIFSAREWTAPNSVRYQFRLNGFDENWQAETKEAIAEYRNIPPGSYTFELRAKGISNQWSTSVVYPFKINPPWWQTNWAFLTYTAILILAFWQFSSWRTRILLRRNLELEENIRIRTKELQESLDTLKRTQDQLIQSEKMASLGQMVAGIAHEFNNPLNFMVANAQALGMDIKDITPLLKKILEIEKYPDKNIASELLKMGKTMDLPLLLDELESLLNGIQRGGERLQSLVKNLLIFTHQDQKEKQLEDVHSNLTATLHVLDQDIQEKNIKVISNYSNIPMVPCHSGKISQALINLISNAIDSMKFGGVLTISTGEVKDSIFIKIQDTGDGMTEDVKQRIFEPFFTTKKIGEGTGLGLSITYGLIKEHGGLIEVTTKPGKGSTFTIVLPKTEILSDLATS